MEIPRVSFNELITGAAVIDLSKSGMVSGDVRIKAQIFVEGCSIEINMISYDGSSQEPHKFYVADMMEQKSPGLKIRPAI